MSVLNKREYLQLEAAQMKFPRLLLGFKELDHQSNTDNEIACHQSLDSTPWRYLLVITVNFENVRSLRTNRS
jgi:hypothetical protein